MRRGLSGESCTTETGQHKRRCDESYKRSGLCCWEILFHLCKSMVVKTLGRCRSHVHFARSLTDSKASYVLWRDVHRFFHSEPWKCVRHTLQFVAIVGRGWNVTRMNGIQSLFRRTNDKLKCVGLSDYSTSPPSSHCATISYARPRTGRGREPSAWPISPSRSMMSRIAAALP